MRGRVEAQGIMFHAFQIEDFVPADHPLRSIKRRADAILKDMSADFSRAYTKQGAGILDGGNVDLVGRWTHATGTWDGFEMTLYIDGERASSLVALRAGLLPTNRPVAIGRPRRPRHRVRGTGDLDPSRRRADA